MYSILLVTLLFTNVLTRISFRLHLCLRKNIVVLFATFGNTFGFCCIGTCLEHDLLTPMQLSVSQAVFLPTVFNPPSTTILTDCLSLTIESVIHGVAFTVSCNSFLAVCITNRAMEDKIPPPH